MLPIWTTVKQSYGWVRDHLRLLALPMAALFAVQLLQEILSLRLPPDAWPRIAATFLLLIVDGAFSVGLFHAVILDEARGGLGFLRWGFELWRYLKTVLIATIGVVILGLAVMMLAGASFRDLDFQSWKIILIGVIAALPVLYLAARLLFAFPAAALGKDKVFRLSWKISKGTALRLLATLFLTTLLPTLVESLLDLAAASAGPLAMPAALISSAIEVLDTALITTALSLSYRLLAPAPIREDPP